MCLQQERVKGGVVTTLNQPLFTLAYDLDFIVVYTTPWMYTLLSSHQSCAFTIWCLINELVPIAVHVRRVFHLASASVFDNH